MIIGFSRHGTGTGSGPVDYMTDDRRQGREDAAPVVLRGSPSGTRDLIDSLDFKHKYTSGVLSFAPSETVTPAMEQAFMDRFEQLAFAGLDADQYNILWVRHSHAGHHELHFVTPRVELCSGKSLNIRPPGDLVKAAFDDLRSEINARHGLADPDDPRRKRDVAQPDHALKIAAEALRRGEKPQEDVRTLIDAVLSQRAAQGFIRSRSDVVAQISDLGMEVTREGKNYITVCESASGERWRLKGGLYEREFDATRTIEAAAPDRERNFAKPDPAAAEQFAQRVERHIHARAGYHAQRYAPAAARDVRSVERRPTEAALDRYPVSPSVSDARHGSGLARYLSERLGSQYVAGVPHRAEPDGDRPAGSDHRRHGENHGRRESPEGDERPVRGVTQGRESGQRLEGGQAGRTENNEVEHDGAGKSLVERIEAFIESVQRATQGVKDGAGGLAGHVRAYVTGQRHAVETGRELERAGRNLSEGSTAIREPLREEQRVRSDYLNRVAEWEYQRALERQRQEQERLAQEHKPSRSFGPSM